MILKLLEGECEKKPHDGLDTQSSTNLGKGTYLGGKKTGEKSEKGKEEI